MHCNNNEGSFTMKFAWILSAIIGCALLYVGVTSEGVLGAGLMIVGMAIAFSTAGLFVLAEDTAMRAKAIEGN